MHDHKEESESAAPQEVMSSAEEPGSSSSGAENQSTSDSSSFLSKRIVSAPKKPIDHGNCPNCDSKLERFRAVGGPRELLCPKFECRAVFLMGRDGKRKRRIKKFKLRRYFDDSSSDDDHIAIDESDLLLKIHWADSSKP